MGARRRADFKQPRRAPRHDWGFNAWGGNVDGLYPSWENDNRVARKFCDLLGDDVYDKRDFICEGGSIHTDGEGRRSLPRRAC